MKNLLSSLLFCGVLLCFVSCEDESEPELPEPIEVPETPFEALAPNDTLSLSETLRLQKPESIESAKIYLDNSLLSSLESAPFEYEFNTRAHADGEYSLRAEVNYSGNQQETFDLSVHFINTLATVSIPEGELEHADEIYLIASGRDGEIFGLTAVDGPGTYTIQAARKGFGSTVSLSLLAAGAYRFEEDEKFTEVRTLNGIPLQSQTEAYFYHAEFYDGEKGNAGIQVPDLEEQLVYFQQEQAYSGPSVVSSRELTSFPLYADPSWLGIYKVEDDRYYYSLQQVNPQDELVLPLAEIDQAIIRKEMNSSYYDGYSLNLVPDPALYPQTSLHFWAPASSGNGTFPDHYLSPSDPELAQELTFYRSEEENSSRMLSLYGTNPEPFVPDFVDILSASLKTDGEVRLTTSSSAYTYSLSGYFRL